MFSPEALVPNNEYYEHLGSNVWLMDNHKWALYIWELSRLKNGAYCLIHVDYHWDAGYDFWEQPDEERRLFQASPEELQKMIASEHLIQYDSFIGPAIARGLIDQVHFLCFQEDSDQGFYPPVLQQLGGKQTLHQNSDALKALYIDKPILFDFCLDVFNRSKYDYQSDLWRDPEIDKLLADCERLVRNAAVVTVSASFGCSGTEDDTRLLIKRVVPMFLDWRRDS